MANNTVIYNPDFTIYKPGFKDHKQGTALKLEFNQDTLNTFLVVAKQLPDKNANNKPVFDWKGAKTFKMGIPDLTAVLSLLNGWRNYLGNEDGTQGKGLYHQNSRGNAIMKMYPHAKGQHNWVIDFSFKDQGSDAFRTRTGITDAEAAYMEVIIRYILTQTFRLSNRVEKN
jgi:hypothetical protein